MFNIWDGARGKRAPQHWRTFFVVLIGAKKEYEQNKTIVFNIYLLFYEMMDSAV